MKNKIEISVVEHKVEPSIVIDCISLCLVYWFIQSTTALANTVIWIMVGLITPSSGLLNFFGYTFVGTHCIPIVVWAVTIYTILKKMQLRIAEKSETHELSHILSRRTIKDTFSFDNRDILISEVWKVPWLIFIYSITVIPLLMILTYTCAPLIDNAYTSLIDLLTLFNEWGLIA